MHASKASDDCTLCLPNKAHSSMTQACGLPLTLIQS